MKDISVELQYEKQRRARPDSECELQQVNVDLSSGIENNETRFPKTQAILATQSIPMYIYDDTPESPCQLQYVHNIIQQSHSASWVHLWYHDVRHNADLEEPVAKTVRR